ncbi:hypothetical protein TNCV_4031011 [Trichonephila clavipes]|nr:hypothetical protein TNCV_4031011 [Trichonephila clavipes]
MPSCHSVYDLELAVQDLWAHSPQDNIRCLMNSMLDRVVACIAAGFGLSNGPGHFGRQTAFARPSIAPEGSSGHCTPAK